MKNYVKITGGTCRGQKIATPGGDTHPMGERERIALFNMLGERVRGKNVHDVFAGSGTLGLEALSRGAERVVFVEKDPNACKIIKDNINKLGFQAHCDVIYGNAYRTLTAANQFDLVFADPPYDAYDEKKLEILTYVVANPGGILVLSHPGPSPEMPGIRLVTTRQYARAHISIYEIA